jgi:putative transposase
LNLLTPASVHYGQSETVRQQRQATLAAAYAQHPQRFVRAIPSPIKQRNDQDGERECR